MLKVFIQFYGCPIEIFNGIDFLRSIVTLTQKRIAHELANTLDKDSDSVMNKKK